MPTIRIDYGYDSHSITVSEEDLKRFKSGESFELDGQGFIHEEDGLVIDHWVFNDTDREVYFYLDNSAEFNGNEVWIDE